MPSRDKYTDPKLRDEVKEEIHEGDKGGAPGQWSARKAQMMASEYKKRGGGYTTDKKDQDESQKNLEKWTDEDWQTKDGSGNAKQEDGSQKRYLPKKAWESMTEKEKKETDDKKQAGSKQGKQHVQNTGKAKQERQKANEKEDEEFEEKKAEQGKKGDKKSNQKKSEEKEDEDAEEDDEEYVKKNDQQDDNDENQDVSMDDEEEKDDVKTNNKGGRNLRAGTKRNHETDTKSPNKKQKSNDKKDNNSNNSQKKDKATVGSRKDPADPPAAKGSKTRLPEKGANVHWKALPGYVEGEVVEIVTSHKKVEGKDVKASKDDPRIVLKSSSSGKICVHKPEAVFFE